MIDHSATLAAVPFRLEGFKPTARVREQPRLAESTEIWEFCRPELSIWLLHDPRDSAAGRTTNGT